MRLPLAAALVAAAQLGGLAASERRASQRPAEAAHERRIAVGRTSLYARDIGGGQPIVVLHGGPDFDTSYLLPDLDALADTYRLIYYDQRGRGKSAAGVRPEDVSLASELDDLGAVLAHYRLISPVLLGHSWGTVLALEYAIRHPTRVSRLVLMNPAPASSADLAVTQRYYAVKVGADLERQRTIMATAAYQEGDPDTVAARYRLHFKPALKRTADYDTLMARMKVAFAAQGKEGIVRARAVEDRLMLDTWRKDGYDLAPALRTLNVPTLVLYGDADFIPQAIAERIASVMPNARLTTFRDCGHFSYLECPRDVRSALEDFLRPRRVRAPLALTKR